MEIVKGFIALSIDSFFFMHAHDLIVHLFPRLFAIFTHQFFYVFVFNITLQFVKLLKTLITP